MPENNAAEPSITDLRTMLSSEGGDAETIDAAPAAETAKPAAEAKTAPDPGPDVIAEVDAAETNAAADKTPAGVQKRIDKAVKAQRAAERRAEELEAQLADKLASPSGASATESRPATAKPAAETAPPAKAAEGKPLAKDFQTYEDFNEALVDWKLAAKAAVDAKAANERKAAEANAAQGAAYLERVEAVKKVHADFDEVMEGAATLPISEAMHVAIIESDAGPAVAYHLATHPDEAARIAKLTPLTAAREIGKIEAALAAPASAKPAAAKPLPKPPAQAGGSHSPSEIDLSDDKLSVASFKREFQKRLKAA